MAKDFRGKPVNGRIFASGLGGKNPSVGVEVDRAGTKSEIDYKQKWKGCSQEETKMISDLVDEAKTKLEALGVEVTRRGTHLVFSGIGDMAACMQVFQDLNEALCEFGLKLADEAGEGEKAKKAKKARKAKK